MDWTRSARGAVDIKMVIAVLFAVGGLSWAGISIMSGGSGKDGKGSGQRALDAAVDREGNQLDTSYTKASSSKQLGRVQEEIQDAIVAQSQIALKEIDVPKGMPDGVSDATINAFIPLLSGDHNAFLEAIVAMGGVVPGELQDDHPMFTHLSKVFKDAKVDLTRITVERFVAPEIGPMGMARREVVTEDEEIEPGEGGRSGIQTQVMELQPASLFPDAPPKQDTTAIQIKIPVQPKGEKNESVFALILTWNTDAKHWQPAAYQVIRNRLVEDD